MKQSIIEKVVRKKAYRDGKLKLIKKSDKKGYKIVDGKEKKMSAQERRSRRISARKTAKRMKSNKSAVRKRVRSMKKSLARS